jgi:hypothetical protein
MNNRQQTAKPLSIPSPFGGLNAKDSIAAMPITDAVILDNWFPSPEGCIIRNGSIDYVTGFAYPVESIMTYRNATTSKMFAAAGAAIYDATTAGEVGAAVVSGLVNARFQHVNYGTAGGQYLVAVNGAAKLQLYNGSIWQGIDDGVGAVLSTITVIVKACTATTATNHGLVTGQYIIVAGCTPAELNGTWQVTVTGPTTFTFNVTSEPGGPMTVTGTYTDQIKLTGVATTLLIHVNLYGSRLWFTELNSCRVWYTPSAAVGGALTSIDFSPLFRLGGYLVGMMTWTLDNANGVNEYAVFVSSQGEVLVYGGGDPASASTWGLVAHVRMGRPVGRRFFTKVGSDAFIICADGFYPLHESLLTDRSQTKIALSDKIQNLVNNDVHAYGTNFGWQAILYPIGNKLIINVPSVENTTSYQYVLNTINNAFCRFTGWNANCFEIFGDELFYGGATAVVHCETGTDDNGADIIAECLQAFSNFDVQSRKQFTMIRPIFYTSASLIICIQLNTDFSTVSPSQEPTYIDSASSMWDVSAWDVSAWGDSDGVKAKWLSVSSIGYYAAIHLKVASNGFGVKWSATDYLFKIGGPL